VTKGLLFFVGIYCHSSSPIIRFAVGY
jgi:hypothetical protein